MQDEYHLDRFLLAQAPVYDDVVEELRQGRKRSHWMWFVFPQITGLGRSAMANHYAIASLDEARAYLAHPVLGARLRECATLALNSPQPSALALFGPPDDMKFRSCMTLFAEAAPQELVFAACLRKFFDGRPDAATLEALRAQQ
ncbi:Uncharacterized protein, DUF1810 family [Noviherbaspirillum humi]|uniref:Uncharacterized protein, DUF1810 family n=1 Tax=Noviherbaspirillum humi TaxID=1688639 RepID=A0A239HYL9_9BURK|nr:DUF1810 domain-containing protein [Noviherbaspirillum humi]SNS86415.1 Uncharacterized protein, DUF1810 family [Noviherbaspirillum humi]